eukprot:jgi/Ulvmu1/1273/UM109_0071.1
MQQAARMRGCSLHWNDHVSVFWRCLRYSAGYSSLSHGPGLRDFLGSRTDVGSSEAALLQSSEHRPKVFLKTYGCQMNVSDSELVTSILASSGYTFACDEAAADVILLNTCAIREGAEQKVWGKLRKLKSATATAHARHPVIGVLGCMAERLKDRLLESQLVQVVAGPDAYRDLPRLLQLVREGATQAMNVQLSAEETYADVAPVRSAGSHAAFVSIMRGCNNMCSFCVVPYTRGRERSRMLRSIVAEVRSLSESGVKEVTLLGQNVNSYADFSASTEPPSRQHASADRWYAKGFQSVYKPNREGAKVFAELLDECVPMTLMLLSRLDFACLAPTLVCLWVTVVPTRFDAMSKLNALAHRVCNLCQWSAGNAWLPYTLFFCRIRSQHRDATTSSCYCVI